MFTVFSIFFFEVFYSTLKKSIFFSLFVARDRKHHSLSVGSEVDDEEGSAMKDSDETMKVPKPKSSKMADSDSDDDAFDDKPA